MRARTEKKDVGEQLPVAATTHTRARTDEKDVGEQLRVGERRMKRDKRSAECAALQAAADTHPGDSPDESE